MMFTTESKNISGFLGMARVLSFLENCPDRRERVEEIERLISCGFLSEEEGTELYIEYC